MYPEPDYIWPHIFIIITFCLKMFKILNKFQGQNVFSATWKTNGIYQRLVSLKLLLLEKNLLDSHHHHHQSFHQSLKYQDNNVLVQLHCCAVLSWRRAIDVICALGLDRLHACLKRLSTPCHLCIWEVEMSLLSEACYCCGERGLSAWPLNAEMTPREKKRKKGAIISSDLPLIFLLV